MKWIWFFLLFTGIVRGAKAQFTDSTHYHIKYAATGIYNKTNETNSFVLNNSFLFGVSQKRITLNTTNTWIYGMQGNNLSNNDFSSYFNFDYLKNQRKIYYWGLASFVTSYSLNINRQLQAGIGIGYNIVNKKNAELVISDGLLYEASDLKTTTGIDENYQTVRNSLRIKHRWNIADRVKIEGVHFWQVSVERFEDYIIRTDLSVAVKLRRWLSLVSSVSYNRFARTNKENLLINFGLSAENYF